MTQSFDDMDVRGCTFNPMSTDYHMGFESGAQSKQAKIDELRDLFESVVGDDMKKIKRLESVINENNVDIKELQAKIDDLTELNRLKTIALEQSVNRTSIHVHEKIVALENKLRGA